MFRKMGLAAAAAVAFLPFAAQATTYSIFDGITAGRANFMSTVSATGGTANSDLLSSVGSGTTIDRGAYTIGRANGGSIYGTTYGTMSGGVIDISPYADATGAQISGLTLAFDSPVNAIGFEVGDWATCCFISNLYISFDGGPGQLVASADDYFDGLYPSQSNPLNLVSEIYVAAFDDTGSFSTVTFWGDGIGEYLVMGGQIDYALIDHGSLPAVPLPASGLLLLAGLGGLAGLRRRIKH